MLPMLHDLFAAPRYGGPEFEKAVLDGQKDFTDPDYVASIETLEEVTPYFPEDVVGVDYATAQTLFTAEQAAMYPGGSFELAFFQDQNPDLDMGVFRCRRRPARWSTSRSRPAGSTRRSASTASLPTRRRRWSW